MTTRPPRPLHVNWVDSSLKTLTNNQFNKIIRKIFITKVPVADFQKLALKLNYCLYHVFKCAETEIHSDK